MKKKHESGGLSLFCPFVFKLLRVMKILVVFICFIGLLSSFGKSYSQNIKLSVEFKNSSIENVLNYIESRTEYSFMYDNKKIDISHEVNINVKNQTIESILDQLFENGVNYQMIGKHIIITPKESQLNTSTQQQKSISGKVTDSTGATLPGVSVVVKGTTQGMITDSDGKYSISKVPENATLQFSFVGMKTQEVAVSGKTTINITLEEDAIGIEEVVAVGYGSVKKSDLTGSVSSVKTNELQQTPMTAIDQGLVGRASGVMVTQTSGMPGAIASIRVRGSSSLQGGNEPLYVIDGFPIYNGSGFGNNSGGNNRLSGLSTINPSDIESIEILKDASATSIYGARAANGVVLITTKSGKIGKDRITFDANYGIQRVTKKIDVMNAWEYAQLVNEAYTNDGLAAVYSDAKMAELKENPKGTDWQDELFRTAPTQNYQLTFSGGDKKMVYSISANYLDQDGIILNSGFARYSGRVNLERKVLDNFRIGTHLSLSKTITNIVKTDASTTEGVVSSALQFNPILPVYSNEGLGTYTFVSTPGLPLPNPVASANEEIRLAKTNRMLGDLFGEWEIISGLKAKVSFGVDLFDAKYNTFTPSTIYESNGVSTASISGDYTTNWLNENTLNWSKKINDNHSFSVLAGMTLQKNMFESFSASSQNFINNVLEENNLGSGSVYRQPNSTKTEWSLLSYLGRINYNMKDRYLLTFSSRIDGSSRFGENNKYAFFPSGSFAWRMIEEDFIKKLGLLSNLKLRASYGITGNQEIGLYSSLPTLTNTTYTINRALVTGFFPNIIPNPNLKWEKTAQFDVGLDIGFLENKLRLTSDYYHKKTTDLIYSVAVPYVTGYSSSLQNIGSIENQGVELSIESDNINKGDFSWNTSFNISLNRNKVLELGGESYKDVGASDTQLGSIHRLIVGKPIGLFYGYVFDGIIQNQEELNAGPVSSTNWIGARRFKDLGGAEGVPDGKIDATYDRTVIGDPNPDFFGGLTNTFSYKGVEVNIFMQYSYGNDIFNYNSVEMQLPSGGQNVYHDLVNRWTPTNPSNIYPKATTNRAALFSTAYIQDGSYLKIKTLTLAYTFPKLKSKNLDGLKIYVSGQNLFTFTKYKVGYDPEVSFRGASTLEVGEDNGGYPQSKTIMFGVKLDIK